MAATFAWKQTHSGSPGTVATCTNLNLVSTPSGVDVDPGSNPITAGSKSYESFFRGEFSGTFTAVTNIRFYKSGGDYKTGEQIVFGGSWTIAGSNSTYWGPIATTSPWALGSLPATLPASANVSIGNSVTGSLTTYGFSDYCVMQNTTSASTPAGAVNQKTLCFVYDEA